MSDVKITVYDGASSWKAVEKMAAIKKELADGLIGDLFDPIAPGTQASPAIIPEGPADKKRKFTPSPGFYQGFPEVTSDKRWEFYWKGTPPWDLRDLGDLPERESVNIINPLGSGIPSELAVSKFAEPIFGSTSEEVIFGVYMKNAALTPQNTVLLGTGTSVFIKVDSYELVNISRDNIQGNRFRILGLSTPSSREPETGDTAITLFNDNANENMGYSVGTGTYSWIMVYLNSSNPFQPGTSILAKGFISSKNLKDSATQLIQVVQKPYTLNINNTIQANGGRILFFKSKSGDVFNIKRSSIIGDRFRILGFNQTKEPVAGDLSTTIFNDTTNDLLEYEFKSLVNGWIGIYCSSNVDTDRRPANFIIENRFKKGDLSYLNKGRFQYVTLDLYRGSIGSNGLFPFPSQNAEWKNNDFYKNFRTEKYLNISFSINRSFEINFDALSEYNVTVFQYDDAYQLIANFLISSAVVPISNSAEMVKFSISRKDGQDIQNNPIVRIYAQFKGEKYSYNEGRYNQTMRALITSNPFNGRDLLDENIASNPLQYSNRDLYTHCIIRTPPNYDPKGEPVRVIYFAHSSAQATIWDFNTNYLPYVRYLVDQGYMLIDVFAWSNEYPNAIQYMNTPTNVACSNALYDFVSRNYNIKRDGVFIAGKSHGGYQVYSAEYMFSFKILAAASLAGAIDFANKNYGYENPDRLAVVKDLGIPEDPAPILSAAGSNYNPAARQWLRRNSHYFQGYVPLTLGSIDFPAINAFPDIPRVGDQVDLTMEFTAISRVPTKTWVSPDDTNISYSGILSRKRAVERGGGVFELRVLPVGTDDPHHTTDTEGPFVPSIVAKNGIVHTNIPVAYAEMLQFFKRFEI